ncbi:phage tail tape measure protein [Mesoaciditoga lauensis]|uniref:phage tail tape measure protein n=1 Tax=Mesoaciditoga lauensis TaxID=1495039 RepID=UPI0005656D28|nr:phage tail tape measure protein [Mesoaciditoga lauensis]
MNLGSLWIDVKARTGQFKESMIEARQTANGLTVEAGKAEKSWKTAFSAIGEASHALLGAGAAIEGVFGLAVYQAGKLNQAMADLQSVMKLNADQIDTLKEKAIEYSKAHMTSASEITKAYYNMASAGMTYEQIVSSVEQTATLSIATFGSMAEATDIMTDAMNTYVKEMPDYLSAQEKANRVTNIFAGAVKEFKIILPELRAGLANVTSTAYAMHIPLQDVVTQLGLLKNAGMSAEEAGTALNRAYMAAPQLFKQFGINALDAAGHMRPLADILDELKQKLGGAIDSTAEMTKMQTTFGIRGIKAVEILMNQTDAIRNYSKYLVESNNAAEMAEAREKGFNAQMKILWNNIKDLGAEVGSILLPVVKQIIDFMKGIIDGFNNLNPNLKQAIVMITAFGGAGALLVGILGSLVGMLPGLIAGFSLLATSPFGWVAGAIIGITALVGWIQAQKKAYDDLIASTDKLAKSQKAQADNESALLSEYEALRDKANKTADEKARLKKISQDLAELAPQSIKGINDETGAWNLNAKAIQEDIEKRKELAKMNAEKALKEAQKRLDAAKEELKFTKEGISYTLKEIDALQNTATAQERIKKNQEEITKLQKSYNDYKKEEWKLNNDYNKGLISLKDLEEKRHELTIKESEALVKIGHLRNQNKDLEANALADEKKKQELMAKYQNELLKLTKQQKEQTAEVEKQQKVVNQAQEALNEVLGIQKKVTAATNEQAKSQKKVTEAVKNTVTSLSQLKDIATKYAEQGKELEFARQNLNMSDLDYYKAKQNLLKQTITDISKLQAKSGELSDADKKYLDVLKSSYSMVSEKVSKLQKEQDGLNTSIDKTKDISEQLTDSLHALNMEHGVTLNDLEFLRKKYTLYTNAYNALAEKKAKGEKLTNKEIEEFKKLKPLIDAISKQIKNYGANTAKTTHSVSEMAKGVNTLKSGIKNVIKPLESFLMDIAKETGFKAFQKDLKETNKALADGRKYYEKTGDLLGTLKMNAKALSEGIAKLHDNIAKNGATKIEIEQLKEWQTQLDNTNIAIQNMESRLERYNNDVKDLENIDFKLSLTSNANEQIPLLKRKLETLAQETKDIKYINLKPDELRTQLNSITKDVYSTTQSLVNAIGTMYQGSTDKQMKALTALKTKLQEIYKDNPVALKASLGLVDNAIENTKNKAIKAAREASKKSLQELQNGLGAIAGLIDAIGNMSGQDFSGIADGFQLVANGIQILSTTIEAGSGPIGWIIAGIQLLTSTLNFMNEQEKKNIETMKKFAEAIKPQSYDEFVKSVYKGNEAMYKWLGISEEALANSEDLKKAWKEYADEIIKSSDSIKSSIQDFSTDMDVLNSKFEDLSSLHPEFKDLASDFENLGTQSRAIKDKIDTLNKQLEDGKISVQQYNYELAKLKDQQQTLDDLANSFKELGKVMEGSGAGAEIARERFERLQRQIKQMGDKATPEWIEGQIKGIEKLSKAFDGLDEEMEGNGAKASVLRKKYAEFKAQLEKMGDKASNEWIESQIDGIKKLGEQIDKWQQTLTSGLESALTKYVNFFKDMSESQKMDYMKKYLEDVKHMTFKSTEEMKKYYDSLGKSEKDSLDKGLHDYLNKTVRYDTFKKAFDSTLKKAILNSLIQSLVTQGIIGKKVQELAAFISVAMKDGLSKGELDTIKYMMQGIEKESKTVGDAISGTMDDLETKGTTSTDKMKKMIKDYLGETEDDTKKTTDENSKRWDDMAQKIGDSVSGAIEKMLEKFGLLPLKADEVTNRLDESFSDEFGYNGKIHRYIDTFVDNFKHKFDFNPFKKLDDNAGTAFNNIWGKFNRLIDKMKDNSSIDIGINAPKITTPTISPTPSPNLSTTNNSQVVISPGAIQVNGSQTPTQTADEILDRLTTEITKQRQILGRR